MCQIEIKNISKSYDSKKVLNNISLNVEDGEMISLVGPSGCGKSTTLKIIAGLVKPDSGDILFNGESILGIPVEKRETALVFQDYLLFPHMTVEENIGFGLRMAKVRGSTYRKKVYEMIELVELEGYEKRYPRELSGGQKQRTALARALAINPKVLLLDEPFSNLDLRLKENMREFVCELQKKLGITTILVTHDKEEALMLSNRVALMLEGNIVQYGKPAQVYETPVSKSASNFFGERNYISGKIEKGIFKSPIINFNVKTSEETEVEAAIKPEDIVMFPYNKDFGISGIIKKKIYAGDRTYYIVDVNGIKLKCMSVKSLFNLEEHVSLEISESRIICYEKSRGEKI